MVDHRQAAALCATCPALAACRDHLAAVRADAQAGGQPEGTWAGELVGGVLNAHGAAQLERARKRGAA